MTFEYYQRIEIEKFIIITLFQSSFMLFFVINLCLNTWPKPGSQINEPCRIVAF